MASKIDIEKLNQNEPFVIKYLEGAQFLSPAVQTAAITSLAHRMTTHFAGVNKNPNDKPTCVTCFEMSGTGKTTTIKEAAKLSKSIRAPISLINNQLFIDLFQSCRKFGSRQSPRLEFTDLVSYAKVEEYMTEQFDLVLTLLFQSITEQLDSLDPSDLDNGTVLIPAYIKPTSNSKNILTSPKESYDMVIDAVKKLNRLLVIHLDDCQEFFCGSIKNPQKTADNMILVGDLMCFALRLFYRRVSSLVNCREILWVFSGTRRNLYLEMKVAGTFGEPYDVAKTLRDLTENDIVTILSNYFRLDQGHLMLKKKFKNLCGHPKMLYWFILSAQQHTMASVADLIALWDKIEDDAVALYRQRIKYTISSFGLPPEKLGIYVRNLCLLHTHAFLNNTSGFLEFDELPPNWMPLIEAGLVRTVESRTWKLYPPNRFLVKIFNDYVKWFNWDNIQHLVADIKASGSVTTFNGKVFELIFALELSSLSNSPLWTRLTHDINLRPRLDWNPSIAIMDKVDDCVDTNVIYVMKDPVHCKLKTDVVFYALQNSKPVRVLCQLTVQQSSSTTNANEALQEMLKISSISDMTDCRIFSAPKSSIRITETYKNNFNDNNCYFFDIDAYASIMKLPFDFCNPAQTVQSLKMLMDIAKYRDDANSAQNIGMFLPGSSLKRKREEFINMVEFYEALREWGRSDAHIKIIKEVFEDQLIEVSELPRLTDEKLKEAGLKQIGLREAILAILGK